MPINVIKIIFQGKPEKNSAIDNCGKMKQVSQEIRQLESAQLAIEIQKIVTCR